MGSLVPPRHILSKSTYMYGCQCPKRLWLYKHQPNLRDPMSEAQAAIFQGGADVGLLARELFPGGVDASPGDAYSWQQSVADTSRYIREGQKVIYEAAFQFNGVLCAMDIIVKTGSTWKAYEVKSSCSVKPAFIMDAALQFYVISQTGLPLSDISIVHLNNKYIRKGTIDLGKLFHKQSILKEVIPLQDEVGLKVDSLKKVVKLNLAPGIETGKHCHKPYACDFIGHCWNQPPDIIEEMPLRINKQAIKHFISGVSYPLYFMDFETWMTAVPEQDGHWPYRSVNFQYSLHVQQKQGGCLQHISYLAANTASTQKEFIESLLEVTGQKGTVLVYNKTFEKTRLSELAAEFPGLKWRIEALQDRLVDLMVPFRNRDYYDPGMGGRYSIKVVLPALVPGMTYDDLAISNGGNARTAFYNLNKETDPVIIERVKNQLLAYCEQDTLAMVKIFEKLLEV